jgi:hypothetical protein
MWPFCLQMVVPQKGSSSLRVVYDIKRLSYSVLKFFIFLEHVSDLVNIK